MEIVTRQIDVKENYSSIGIRHGNEEISWSVSFLDSATRGRRGASTTDDGGQGMSIDYDPYLVLNEYWKFLPQDKQARIFDVYRRIKEVFNTVFQPNELNMALVGLVKELDSYHEMEHIAYWIDFKSQQSKTPIRMPLRDPNLLAEHDLTNSSKKPKEGTYTLGDYHMLVVMSLAIRCMIPVWGSYIEMMQKTVGTNLKEYESYHLLRSSSMYHSVPMEKLREYVRFLTRPDIPKPSAVYFGISSEEFPEWMLGLVVVRKLGCLDITHPDISVSNMKTLFNYIGHKLKNHENSFRGTISEKIFEGTKVEGENNLSTLEGYRNPLDISVGDTERYPIYMTGGGGYNDEETGEHVPIWGQPLEKAQRICPDIDPNMFEKMLNAVFKSHSGVPEKGQLQLIQIVLNINNVLPPQALGYLGGKGIKNAIAIAAACLWHRGHYDLAALVSARLETGMANRGGSEHRTRIPQAISEELNKLYPYARRLTARTKQEDQENPALQQIASIDKLLKNRNWILTLPKEWVMELNKGENNRRYQLPADIRIKLANLVIAMAKRSF